MSNKHVQFDNKVDYFLFLIQRLSGEWAGQKNNVNQHFNGIYSKVAV